MHTGEVSVVMMLMMAMAMMVLVVMMWTSNQRLGSDDGVHKHTHTRGWC